MKKIILSFIAAAALLTACDPECDDKSLELTDYTADQISDCISFKVYKDADFTEEAGPAEGNYVKYTTSPATSVSIINYNSDGSENVLAYGASGSFKLSPKRGSSTDQVVTVRVVNTDNSVVDAQKTISVWVKEDLDPELKLLLGEAGEKMWGWSEDGYEVWGNAGNAGGGANFAAYNVDSKWWGVTKSEYLIKDPDDGSQLNHAVGDETLATLDAQSGSYMLFDEDGNISSYTADGTLIRSSTYTLSDYDPSRSSGWQIATLETKKPAILWPYSINENGTQVTKFDVMYLDANHMTLVYTKGNGAGSWGEITFWRFENLSPSSDALENAEKWYWANDTYVNNDGETVRNEVWGNAGNTGNGSLFTWNNTEGKWWGVTNPSYLVYNPSDESSQLAHAGNVDYGDGDDEAYMIFKDGKVTTYKPDGSVIRSGSFEVEAYSDGRNNGWEIGKLKTSEPALLFPWSINEGGYGVTEFDIMSYSGGYMTLVYTKGNGSGSWGEITFWRFSNKH